MRRSGAKINEVSVSRSLPRLFCLELHYSIDIHYIASSFILTDDSAGISFATYLKAEFMRSTFKVLFYLKRDKNKPRKVVPVMGRITVNGSIAQFSAKISVPPALWEVCGGKVRGRSVEADRINRHLDNIRGQINKHYQDICDREGYVTAAKVKNAYLGFGNRSRTLLEAFGSYGDQLHERLGVDRALSTWYRYRTTGQHLAAFVQARYRVRDMALAELEQSFIEQFQIYLKASRGLKMTSVCRYLDCLINVVKIAFNDGVIARNPFAAFRYSEPAPERSSLTEEELRRLQTTPLRQKSLERTRDLFLFSCFTGICHADMRALTQQQLEQAADGSYWISGKRCKTGTEFVVKLLPQALLLLAKYPSRGPAAPLFEGMASVRCADRALKRIARECGIDKNLTFHIARHTFATTISLTNGVPLETLSKMLGHKRITTTQIYARVTHPMIGSAIDAVSRKIAEKYPL